jgi:drug/metabolite transporter (DMT)-like permease
MAGLEWALLLILSVLWGGSFFLVEVAVKELPPLTIVVTRVTLGAGTLLAVGRLMVQLEQGTPSVGSTLTLTSRLTPPRGIRRLGGVFAPTIGELVVAVG